MPSVAIVYFSAQGHTQQLAEAVADGVKSVSGATCTLHRIVGTDIHEGRWANKAMLDAISTADAIIFGTPTYMGGYAAQYKAFIDAASSVWFQLGWKDKIAAGFTHSMGLSGDKLDTLFGLMVNAMQHGMVWVGTGFMPNGNSPESVNRLSSFCGVMAQSNMDQATIGSGDRQTGVLLGQRVAEAATRNRVV
jgi:NAD(P)H dehydrogenase (quinone)